MSEEAPKPLRPTAKGFNYTGQLDSSGRPSCEITGSSAVVVNTFAPHKKEGILIRGVRKGRWVAHFPKGPLHSINQLKGSAFTVFHESQATEAWVGDLNDELGLFANIVTRGRDIQPKAFAERGKAWMSVGERAPGTMALHRGAIPTELVGEIMSYVAPDPKEFVSAVPAIPDWFEHSDDFHSVCSAFAFFDAAKYRCVPPDHPSFEALANGTLDMDNLPSLETPYVLAESQVYTKTHWDSIVMGTMLCQQHSHAYCLPYGLGVDVVDKRKGMVLLRFADADRTDVVAVRVVVC